MKLVRLLPIAALAALAGCTTLPGPGTAAGGDDAARPAADAAAARAEQQMKTMQDMHRKMMAATTPEERAALMAEHMKAMQGGMSMMCDMGAGMNPPAGAGAPETMQRCMEMKDMTMQMMMDRERARMPAAK